ncbi:dynein heavy chain (macronuclear) [Tetrahymena thermophila SB210]|uniref:Dynein heavy chain n=1 Tax=Tetrahymena thermophila (strain SB210) TaxID=312017 RepID=I7LTP7_TETTS|nr:dynein heavy chain [Tetrahymena thermophila SB210]EAR85626.2 dynein heavy chain [Tetrahymena thermophila SB210]|eukprot:XP_001033289.2 dynein heavy chain [Tetrahymena thermophila SB210]
MLASKRESSLQPPFTAIGVSKIFESCVQKNFSLNDSPFKQALLNVSSYGKTWNALVKWVKTQIESDKNVLIPQFGQIKGKLIEGADQKSVVFSLNDSFLIQNNLKYKNEYDDLTFPQVNIQYSQIAKFVEMDKTVVQYIINSIFTEIMSILVNQKKISLNLGLLGIFKVDQSKNVVFMPQSQAQDSVIIKRQAIRSLHQITSAKPQRLPKLFKDDDRSELLNQSIRDQTDLNDSFLNKTMLTYKKAQSQDFSQMNLSFNQSSLNNINNNMTFNALNQTGYSPSNPKIHRPAPLQNRRNFRFMQKSVLPDDINSGMSFHQQKIQSQMKHILRELTPKKELKTVDETESPTRRYIKPDISLINQDLLGAGTDPLARESDFSALAQNASSLINAHFVKPQVARIRFPPVLDRSSRTIAAPVSATMLNLSPSQRIGTNYTYTARFLYLDQDDKCVKTLRNSNNSIQFQANKEYLQPTASLEEELLHYVDRVQHPELEAKIRSKKTCYERYQLYIQEQISKDQVAPMRQYWVDAIFELIPGQFDLLDKEYIGKLIDRMLIEISLDYYNAIRKSILDYVLINEEERQRVGIMQTFFPIVIYGDGYYQGIEPDDDWKNNLMAAKDELLDKMVIYNRATLQISFEWNTEFKPKMKLLHIREKNEELETINNFRSQMKYLRDQAFQIIKKDWNESLVSIYRSILLEIEDNDEESEKFFDSTAILLSNLIRQHITEQVDNYCNFFKRFDVYPRSPQEILADDKRDFIHSTHYDVFLKIILVADDNQNEIKFENEIAQIEKDLIDILEDMIRLSHNIARPEHSLVRSEKHYLFKIQIDDSSDETSNDYHLKSNKRSNSNNSTDELYINSKRMIERIISKNLDKVEEVLPIYNEFSFLLDPIDKFINEFLDSTPTREDYIKKFKEFQQIQLNIEQNLPPFIRMNMILVDGCQVKREYVKICSQIMEKLADSIGETIKQKSLQMDADITKLLQNISKNVDSTQTLVHLEQEIERIRMKEERRITLEYKDLCEWMSFQIGKPRRIDQSEFLKLYGTSQNVYQMMDQVDKEEERIKEQREQIEENLRVQKNNFQKKIEEFQIKIQKLREYSSPIMSEDVNRLISEYNTTLNQMIEEKAQINQDEELLGQTQTEFPQLEEALQNLKPYDDLWSLVANLNNNLNSWSKEGSIFRLDPETIERETKMMFQTSMKLNFLFNPHLATGSAPPKNQTGPGKLISQLVEQIKEFQTQVPIVRALCNPGFKQRHWEEITNVVGFVISIEKEYTLKRLVDLEIIDHLPKLEEISEAASKEFAIEKILIKMREDWDQVQVELKGWKDTGTYIVSGSSIDEMQQILDDQIVKTQTMKSSPYAKIFEKKINDWESWLTFTFDFSEYWVKVQSVWIYLEPIFSSPDILKRLPYEGSIFREVDQNWRVIMKDIHDKLKVLEFTRNRHLLEILKECNNKLEIVQKGLNAYLEGKRASFPRFYFLSNDELLEILSETKDPLRVQPHLKKCFEGIQKLNFDLNKKVHGMYSSEEEYVEFLTQVDTASAQGNVDEWLLQVEGSMIEAVKYAIEKSFEDYQKIKRSQWVQDRCGQSVLNMSMTYWTYETEKAIGLGPKGIQKHLDYLTQSIEDIVSLVRQNISKLNRCTIEALIVLDVHNQDVVSALVKEGISKKEEFAWQSQLRYYWEEANTVVKIINAVVEYNYEYLGNSPRLVITPLTDRCYRTLCGAIHLNYGGAPEGPAGTGKTETVKDLAKALARQCVVFNCSDGLDYKAMGKFFKGLASSGAWSCFDEFNRIDLEVLSVVAQQILTIQLARGKGVDKFVFEDTLIPLKPTCNVFITMNPGYAGRSELPDNLKALFRAVAMMVPDYALIAEIVLYSFGFSDARNLARKIVTTYKLCSEQLSSQDHYDYGMRAVKSVLTAAGNLKRKYVNENESVLMLRAISDVNLAKFLAFDLPLFKGITKDLFPGVELPEIDYSNMFECIDESLREENLQKVPYFVEKIIQLYEMILVRHGLMVVGLPFSGKTSAIKILQKALTKLNERKQMDENKVQITVINPKSIPMKFLYGFNDEISHEWTDGILAVKYRAFAKAEDDDRKWLIFDGPVDAVWIENMNTVLDDNKKLCLNSGEIIAMSKSMNLIFEPMDLQAASPATVSRCGMIYMEPSSMGWQPLYQSWKKHLPKTFKQEDFDELDLLFGFMVDAGLNWIRHKGVEVSSTLDQNLVLTLMRLLKNLLKDFEDEKFYSGFSDSKIKMQTIDNKFMFAFVWGIGGSLTTEYRKQFDVFVKRLANGDIPLDNDKIPRKKMSLPERANLYEYCLVNKESVGGGGKKQVVSEWVLWVDEIKKEEISNKIQPQEILIQTTDTSRYSYMINVAIQDEFPVLLCGPTGTGKSTYIKNILNNHLDAVKYITIEIGFSAQTSCTQTQEIIDSKLDRISKGVYGPRNKRLVVFIDDLNMPAKEQWGAQPPIEILRQKLDQGGWYDNKDKEKQFKQIIDTQLISAMGPPGGGRTFITPRILRHFSLISLANFDDENLHRIFGTILEWYLKKGQFAVEVQKFASKIITGTLDIYKQAISELLPTPAKSHYLFNLRDFAKVIFGICMSDKDKVQNPEHITRLFVHEIWRVFGDRLINDDDRLYLLEEIRKVVARFSMNFDNIFAHLDKPDLKNRGQKDGKVNTVEEMRGLIWTDVMNPMGAQKRYYEEVLDYDRLQNAVEQGLSNYNMMTDKPMDLVLFNFAIEHLLIISRILKSPGGNALLVGVGGSGRQSLTRLAASISDYNVCQIEISKQYGKVEFHEDLKVIMRSAGSLGKPTVFLFTDSQIKQESFVEDINSLLNTFEVPNLFAPDEKADALEKMRVATKQEGKQKEGTPTQMYAYFIERVKKNLHIVLCFSPIGDAFRTRVRMFPSLVNCCTIDWFQEWPQDALLSVANKFTQNIPMDKNIKKSCIELLQYFHQSTINWSKTFFSKLRRKYYVTPTSYIEMIQSFNSLLEEKRKKLQADQFKYENGYEQIIQTEKNIGKMQEDLEALQPQLKQAAIDTEKKELEVTEQAKEADKLKKVISEEEAVVQVAVNEANEIKAECEKDLKEALPALQAAEDALRVLDRKDIDQLKAMKNPPLPVKTVMQALCLILYPNPSEKKKNNETLRIEIDWWAASLKLLNNTGLLQTLVQFDRDNVEEGIIVNLGKFLKDPANERNLDISVVQNASTACKCIIMWINGIYSYYFVYKKVKPKKIALRQAEEKVGGLNATLSKKQKELKEANDKVQRLNDELTFTQNNKIRLQQRYQECQLQLERATQLIESLGGEKGRWKELAEQLKSEYDKLTGDVLISSGVIAYLGAFTSAFRQEIITEWTKLSKERNIPSSENFSLSHVLGDPVKIRSWNLDGLPSDNFSIDNGIVIFKARRWPLCIDPQNQANKWIKKMEQQKGLYIIKLSDSDYLRTLENAIQFGKPVLLENVGEDLDPSLSPILLKQTFVKGNSVFLKLGDQTLEYSKDFRFYITTKLRNPHYLPEISTKVTLINFMITYEGLNDQLLGILVKKERPDLEEEKERLIIEGAQNKAQLFEIEEKILQVLSSDKNILTDEEAIKVLTASKEKSNEINEKQANAEITEKSIDAARQEYQEVSQEASHLFFAISDLVSIDPMYQYSLVYYIDLFSQSILKSEKSANVAVRLDNLKTYFLYSLYSNICRSLFEKDKLLLSFVLCERLLEFKGQILNDHFRFLLTGGLAVSEKLPDLPIDCQWLSNKSWGEINRLSALPNFEEFYMTFYDYSKQWKDIYDSPEPHKKPLPKDIASKFDSFHRLLILRTLRPDKMIPAIMDFITERLGKKFIEPPPFDLAATYLDSTCFTPLIFILSPGSDPFASLNSFSEQKKKNITAISLGQGQGPAAQKMIQDGQKSGNWVVLQNCHLAVSWMPTLEKIIEEFNTGNTDPDFRLWLTSYPSEKFPTAILQGGVKMTTEAPKGLKSNLLGSYLTDPISREDFFNSCQNSRAFKNLLFGLCFFHAVIQERRKYGPLGWNIPYEFNESDLRISVRQLQMFLLECPNNSSIPFAALKYLTSECNYGGRVTDDKDRRLITTLLGDYYNLKVIEDPLYKFAPDPNYRIPDNDSYEGALQFIKDLPIYTKPEVFGFHSNADITKDINETTLFLDSLLLCSSEGGSSEGSSHDDTLKKLIESIMGDFPKEFDVEQAIIKYPVNYNESMNTVLTQELNRFNKLISIIRSSLKDINLALQGKILLSQSLERACKQIIDGKVPQLWMEKSYPSLKPLGAYVNDLRMRLKFFQDWIDNGAPVNFWISGFYFTQSFLTGVLQNFARKYVIPIDEIEFDFKVMHKSEEVKPEDGAYVFGLFIEGSKWNPIQMELDESDPKVLFVQCPTLLLKPSQSKKLSNFPHYNSPVYKTSARRGTLSTTGHSTNFVMWIRLPSSRPEKHWIKRGVALLTQLDD